MFLPVADRGSVILDGAGKWIGASSESGNSALRRRLPSRGWPARLDCSTVRGLAAYPGGEGFEKESACLWEPEGLNFRRDESPLILILPLAILIGCQALFIAFKENDLCDSLFGIDTDGQVG